MANILELFNIKTNLDYIEGRQFQTYNEGESLFPEQKFDTLKFEYFVGADDTPVAAKIHAFDTEAEIGSIEAFKQALEAAYIKKKYQITESDLIALRQPMGPRDREMLERRIFNVLERAVADVRSTVEIMRMQAVANGKLELEVHEGTGTPKILELDYGVPANHKEVLTGGDTWDNPAADIIGDLQRWVETLDVRPTRALTSRKVMALIMKNQNVVNALYGIGSARMVNPADLNVYLVGIGLPQVFVYAADASQNYSYKTQAADGTYTTTPYFPENKFVLLPPGELGQTLYGPTPDEGKFIRDNVITQYNGNVIGYFYESGQDPIGTWAKAASTAIPSFPEAGNVFQAQVLA